MYNNPYDMNFYPYNYYSPRTPKASLFGGLKKYNWNNFLNGTGKTLNVINQAIPIIYQVRPILNNAIKMFRVMNAVRSTDDKNVSNTSKTYNTSSTSKKVNVSTNNIESSSTSNKRSNDDESSLTFFI